MESDKLYLVELRGMKRSYGTAYVVAKNSDLAYKVVREYLKSKNIGFYDDREMEYVRLLAEDKEYQSCGCKLYLSTEEV